MTQFNDNQFYLHPRFIPEHPDPLWVKDADYIVPVVSVVGAGPKGEQGDVGSVGPQGPKGDKGDKGDIGPQGDAFTYEDFTQEEINDLVERLSFVGTYSEDAVITTTDATTSSIEIPFEDFDAFDLLFVDVNGLDLAEGIDYVIGDGRIVLTTPLSEGQKVHLRALRYLISDGEKRITRIIPSGAIATVDDGYGTPYVDSYADVDGVIFLDFHNLRGDQGIQGEQGEQGPQGDPLLFSDLTQEELDSIYENVSFVGTGQSNASYTATQNGETVIPITVPNYQPDDILFVTVDGTLLAEGTDYVVGNDQITLTTPIDSGDKVYFKALHYTVPDGDKNITIVYSGGVEDITNADIDAICV